MPSCRHVRVVPSTTRRPVVPRTWKAVTVVSVSVRMAPTLYWGPPAEVVSVKVEGVVAPVIPGREVEVGFIEVDDIARGRG